MASIKNPISAWKWLCAGLEATLATFEVQGCSGGVTLHCSTLCNALQLRAAGECRIHFTHTHWAHLTPPPYNIMQWRTTCMAMFFYNGGEILLYASLCEQFSKKTNTVKRANKKFFVVMLWKNVSSDITIFYYYSIMVHLTRYFGIGTIRRTLGMHLTTLRCRHRPWYTECM